MTSAKEGRRQVESIFSHQADGRLRLIACTELMILTAVVPAPKSTMMSVLVISSVKSCTTVFAFFLGRSGPIRMHHFTTVVLCVVQYCWNWSCGVIVIEAPHRTKDARTPRSILHARPHGHLYTLTNGYHHPLASSYCTQCLLSLPIGTNSYSSCLQYATSVLLHVSNVQTEFPVVELA